MDKVYIRNELKEVFLYVFLFVTFSLIVPLVAGFSFSGFSESFSEGLIHISDYLGTFLVYIFLMIASLFLIIYPLASLLVINKGEHPATQKNPTWFRIFTVSLIFNPEDSALWNLSEAMGLKGEKNFMRWSKNFFRVFIIATLIFGGLGILQVSNPALNVVGVPTQQLQQITVGSDIVFGSVVPAFSENGTFMFIMFFLLGIVAYFTSKFIKNKKLALAIFFLVGFTLIAPLMGVFWSSFHNIVYGNSDASLQAAFFFGMVGTWMTLLTGIFIYWLLWHFFNNLFIKLLSAIAVTEDIIFIALITWVSLLLFWLSVEYLAWRIRRGKTE